MGIEKKFTSGDEIKSFLSFIFYLLWIGSLLSVFFLVSLIYTDAGLSLWYANKLMDTESFSENSQEIVRFFIDHWEENRYTNPAATELMYLENPLDIPYAFYDADNQFSFASSRGIGYLDYRAYELQIDAQREGEIRIYYEEYYTKLCADRGDSIAFLQTLVKKYAVLSLGLLTIFTLMGVYRLRKLY